MRHFIFLSFFCACSAVASSSVKTSGISAGIHVTADGTGKTTASAALNVGNSLTDYVDLSAGDSLVTTVGSQSQAMGRIDALNAISYQASFNGQDAEGAQYTIALKRTSDASAPNSTCTIPKPFTVTAPAAATSFSRSNNDVVVQYSSSGTTDVMSYDVQGDCIKTSLGTVVQGDSGSFTIAKGSLVAPDPKQGTVTCSITLTLHRTRKGTLDPAYGYGGNIWAEQERSLTLSSAP